MRRVEEKCQVVIVRFSRLHAPLLRSCPDNVSAFWWTHLLSVGKIPSVPRTYNKNKGRKNKTRYCLKSNQSPEPRVHERTTVLKHLFVPGPIGKPSVLQCKPVVLNGAPPRSVMPQPGADAMLVRHGVAEGGVEDGGDRLVINETST